MGHKIFIARNALHTSELGACPSQADPTSGRNSKIAFLRKLKCVLFNNGPGITFLEKVLPFRGVGELIFKCTDTVASGEARASATQSH